MQWCAPDAIRRSRVGASAWVALGLIGLIGGCAPPPKEPPGVLVQMQVGVAEADANPKAANVAVVFNARSEDSAAIAAHYSKARAIPKSRTLALDCTDDETIPTQEYLDQIEAPVRRFLDSMREPIDYVVLTKGVPLRLENEGGYSVDGHLAAMRLPNPPIKTPEVEQIRRSINPYFGKTERFSAKKFGMVLVTRLDGWTREDAIALVDRSLAAERHGGPFLFDLAENRETGGYGELQKAMRRAAQMLEQRGFEVALDTSSTFAETSTPLAGYVTWGSNDGKFNPTAYAGMRFKPGALVETYVSTSGRTFRKPPWGDQSLVADMVSGGATGVKGYVSEPFTFALCRPDVLFDRYTRGFNLAESFYCASPVIKWKDIVLGDPLCAPYAED